MASPAHVVVTGAGGRLGRVLLDRLVRADEIERITAVDLAPPPVSHPKIEPVEADVRDPAIGDVMAGAGAVVHLAFIVERGSRDPERVDSVNIGGTENVVRAALATGVGRIVHASSIAAYGFHPANLAGPLREDAPTPGNDDFYYARTKAVCDRWLMAQVDDAAAAISLLRPSIFLGHRGYGELDIFRRRLFPYIRGRADNPIHVTHEDDVADAFYLALASGARGAFNIATAEPLPLSAWPGQMGARGVGIPGGLALRVADAAYRWKLSPVSPAWLRSGQEFPIVVDSSKARRVLRWQPRYPTTGAVLRALADRPTAAASRGTKLLFGAMATVTRLRGGLPVDDRQRAELRAFTGSVNLVFTGASPSEWHVRFTDGRVGVYRGIDPAAKATTTMSEAVFFDMLTGELSYAKANMTGKIRHRGEGNMSMIVGALVGGFRQAAHAEGRGSRPLRAWGRLVIRNRPAA